MYNDLSLPDIRIAQDSQHLSAMVIWTANQTEIFLTYKDPSYVMNIMYGFGGSGLQWQSQNMNDEIESQASTNLGEIDTTIINVDIRFISGCSFSKIINGNLMYCFARTTDDRTLHLGLRISFDSRGHWTVDVLSKLKMTRKNRNALSIVLTVFRLCGFEWFQKYS